MIIDEKFDKLYQKLINENGYDMEMARKEAQKENNHNNMILILIIIIDVVIIHNVFKVNNILGSQMIGFLIFISLIIYFCIIHRGGKSKIAQYMMEFKTKIIGAMIKSFEEQLEFTPIYRII